MGIDNSNSGISRGRGATGIASTGSSGPVGEREEAVTNFIYSQRWNYLQSPSDLLSGPQAQAYIEELETKTSYQDLANLFQKSTLKKLFGEPVNPRLLFAMVRDLFSVPGVYNPSAEEFFTQRVNTLRKVAEIGVKDQNFRLLETLPQVIVMGNHNEEEFTSHQRIKLWREFQELMGSGRGSYKLPGLVRMKLTADLLANYGMKNSFITVVDQLHSNRELLADIFNSAYQEDLEKAEQIYKELFAVLDSAQLNELYYGAQLTRYFEVTDAMKQIHSAARRVGFEYEGNGKASASTVEILEARPNTSFTDQATTQANTTALMTQSVASLGRFLEGQNTTNANQTRKMKIDINTSKFTSGNKDIAAGLLVMIEALPESSPLRERLEDFLINMPTSVAEMKPPEIKAELLTILKPVFQQTTYHTPDLVNFFGTELSNLEQAAELVTKKVNGNSQLANAAQKMPKITGYFDAKDYANESVIFARQLRSYEEGQSTFTKFAEHLGRYQFSKQGIPVHEYVKKVLAEYEKLIQKFDPKFRLNLEATHDFAERVKDFNEFLADVFIRESDKSVAIQYLRNLCNDYMDGRLNDQTFMQEVKNIQRNCYEPDGAGLKVASDLVYLINKFVKENI